MHCAPSKLVHFDKQRNFLRWHLKWWCYPVLYDTTIHFSPCPSLSCFLFLFLSLCYVNATLRECACVVKKPVAVNRFWVWVREPLTPIPQPPPSFFRLLDYSRREGRREGVTGPIAEFSHRTQKVRHSAISRLTLGGQGKGRGKGEIANLPALEQRRIKGG